MNAPATPAAVATLQQLRTPPPRETQLPAVRASFFDLQGFELMQRVAKAFAASTLVPKEYQGNLANCMIAINMAERIGADPMMVMQNLYIVHGRPGWSAQFLIATFNHCGRFSALRFEWFGERGKDTWGCRAWAAEKDTGEKIVGPDITIALAKAESWYEKSGSKWKTIPQLMLMYRAAAWLIRSHAPEIAMGLQTAEELGDTYDAAPSGDGTFSVTTEALRETASTIEHEVGQQPKAEQTTDAPELTFALIVDKLHSAHRQKDAALLEAHADLIRSLANETQRDEANAIYTKLREELKQ